MTHTPRLKTPKGQRKTAPFEDERTASAHLRASPVEEPAAIAYAVWAGTQDWQGPNRTKLKQWHELSVHDRRAWRAVEAYLRLQIMNQQQVAVTLPAADRVTLVVGGESGAFAATDYPRDRLPRSGYLATVIKTLDQTLAAQADGATVTVEVRS